MRNVWVTRPEEYPHRSMCCGATEPTLGPYLMLDPISVIDPKQAFAGERHYTPYLCNTCMRQAAHSGGYLKEARTEAAALYEDRIQELESTVRQLEADASAGVLTDVDMSRVAAAVAELLPKPQPRGQARKKPE